MFIISAPSRERGSFAAFHQNELVNFAVYALAYSDLKFAPFDLHKTTLPFKEKLDVADWPHYVQGLAQTEWEQWIAQIAHSQQVSWLNAQKKAIEDCNTVSPLLWDLPLVMNGHPGYDESLHELYVQGAIAAQPSQQLSEIETYDNPIDYWQGSPAIRAQLVTLWNRFRVEPHHSRVRFVDDLARSFDFEFYRAINDVMRDAIGEVEMFLPIFFVQYLEPVFYSSGSSLIIGMPSKISHDEFLQLLGSAIREWVQREQTSNRLIAS